MNIATGRPGVSLSAAVVLLLGLGADARAQVKNHRTNAAAHPPRAAKPMNNSAVRPVTGLGTGGRGYRSGYGYGNGNRGNNGRQNNGQVVTQLHSTMTLLARAEHDYQGHRVRAMHEVGNAIRHLSPGTAGRNQVNPATLLAANSRTGNGNGNGNGKGNGNGGANRMPQATSDAHLRNALQSLNAIEGHLTNYGSTQNHARARSSVQQAIQHLNVALNVR